MLEQEDLAVLLEVLFGLAFNKPSEVVDVVLNLIEFFDELLEGAAVDVAQLANQYGIEHSQVPQALQHCL